MTTKDALQSSINYLEQLLAKRNDEIEKLTAENKSLKLAVNTTLPELEHTTDDMYPAQRSNIYYRNLKPREAACMQFRALKEWAGRNMGYGDSDEEKQATGLGGLVYMRDCEVSFVLRFAAEVCEQHNWHREAAKLMDMYDAEMTPWEDRITKEPENVSWWAQ